MHKSLRDSLKHPDGPTLAKLNEQLASVLSSEHAALGLNALLSSPKINTAAKDQVSQALQDYIVARTEAGIPGDLNEASISDAVDKQREKVENSRQVLRTELERANGRSDNRIAQLRRLVERLSHELQPLLSQQQVLSGLDPQLLSIAQEKRNELAKAVLAAQLQEAAAYGEAASCMQTLQQTPIPKFFITVGNVILQNLNSTFSRLGLIDALRLRSFVSDQV